MLGMSGGRFLLVKSLTSDGTYLEIIASLSDPPQPGSFEDGLSRPETSSSTPVTKLATDLRTTPDVIE